MKSRVFGLTLVIVGSALGSTVSAQVTGVPPVLRHHGFELHLARQRVDQHVTDPRTGSGGSWIDHEKCAHVRQGTYRAVPLRRRDPPVPRR